MSSHCRSDLRGAALAALAVCAALLPAAAPRAAMLRVCADPNNLPFSDAGGHGFENALAELTASALGLDGVAYTWLPQRRGFVRNTLGAGKCDVIMGVPADYEPAAPTIPYYRSTYVFVYRRNAGIDVGSMDDPRLRRLTIGVHAVGDDYSSTPGAAALARRGIVDNIVGFSIYGDYGKPHPPSRLIEAVAAGEIDVAIAWGPLAGYFAPRQPVPLAVVPVSPPTDGDGIPFVFDIAMATRREDGELHAALDRVIAGHSADIRRLLVRYGVPLVEGAPEGGGGKADRSR